MNFTFESVTNVPHDLEFRETIKGPLYAIKVMGNVFGWTGKNKDGQWVCWNSRGDFWSSFGETRLAAATKMMDSPWRFFSSRRKIEV